MSTSNNNELASDTDIEQELTHILDNRLLASWLQPIIDFPNRTILGYEALARGPKGSPLHLPIQLFAAAERCGLLRQLEQCCITTAVDRFTELDLPGKLFINIAAPDLKELDAPNNPISQLLISSSRRLDIVLEISEKHPLNDYQRIREVADFCRQHQLQLAIDDLGSGYSGLRTWAEIRPDYVKVDMHFIHDIHSDSVKREFVNSICEISRGLNCKVIAEGIEQPQELEALRNLGIKLGQGYLLQKPAENPGKSVEAFTAELDNCGTMTVRRLKTRPRDTVMELVQNAQTLSPSVTAEDVNDAFIHHPQISSIPIVDNGKPLGLISRSQILELFSGRFSHQLYGRKPVRDIMNKQPVIVDCEARLEEVSQRVTNLEQVDLNEDFIVTRNHQYIGVGKVSDLLRRITDYQMRYARYSNPLTLLPGNVPIYEWIDELLTQGESFHLAYIDLNNFKPFNDTYGYSRGDEVLAALGDILNNGVNTDNDLVGHVGGDDFVILFRSENWRQQCEQIFERFNQERKRFYSDEALAEGGIWSEDRQGNSAFFGLLTIAIGVVVPDPARCHSHHEVARLASDAKHQAKARGNNENYIFLSRRRGPAEDRFARK
ncbi:GGDEF domain-containing protein [Porticoccus sp. W117]|uniref:GGDEF domain-containing protein n=1 Tax=Porticoccus sp. W117 TaxID=3054777 RepID=UPI0025994C16|nr:GGDEF domain-containing protein [Porticoccus sp. W117]MDM3872493.1 GGDEF domain-containing protein [Porticoccus sp. W117]